MPMLEALSRRDLVGLEHQVDALGLGERRPRPAGAAAASCAAGREVLERAEAPSGARTACGPCTSCSPSAGWPTA